MKRRKPPYRFYLITLLALLSAPSFGQENPSLTVLDQRYQSRISAALLHLQQQSPTQEIPLDELLDKVVEQSSAVTTFALLTAVFSQQEALESYLDDRRFPTLITFLLSNGFSIHAEHFLHLAEQHADYYSLATIRLAFARYYADTAQWDQAIQQLSAISINNVLTPLEADHAYLIYGFSLQGKKQHRAAVEYYDRVPASSAHYRLAQLNKALAYLRQDWWTDAQIAIENALAASPGLIDDTTDRLHTVLGFSQIQYGFYRRARDSFRKVRADGLYAERALLGLGLAALHQNDKVGALNAFDHLKRKNKNRISVAESYLLSAFTLSQIAETTSAAAAYAEATAFYQVSLSRIENQKSLMGSWSKESQLREPDVQQTSEMMTADQSNILNTWIERTSLLEQVIKHVNHHETRSTLLELQGNIRQFIASHASEALSLRQSVIESYMGQAHFGLATLYDAS